MENHQLPSGNHRRVVIVGSGPAGYTAAIYAARAGLKPVIITGMEVGGQMTITGDVENYPGFPQPVHGPQLVEDMQAQALACGAEIEYDMIVDIDVDARPFKLTGEIDSWTADTVIIASGATARWLGVEGESEFRGRGVSACATCDGPFFKGKTVVVVGGGNTAVEEAIHLAGLCEKVIIVHRRNQFSAEKILCERISRLENVEYRWGSTIQAIRGEEGVTGGVTHVEIGADGIVADLDVDGVFVAIGHDPATTMLKGKIELDSSGYVVVDPGHTYTSVPGIFAAGDVADPHYRQAITAAGMGCMAALDAERWLGQFC